MNTVTGRILTSSAAAALTLVGALASHEALAQEQGATYDITVTGLWTADRFPLEYPKAGLLTGPHFSGVIGASHNDKYGLFAEGSKPTPGLERLSEEGKHSPLDGEIKAALCSRPIRSAISARARRAACASMPHIRWSPRSR